MSSLKTLAALQKLTKNDILPIFNKLGYPLPTNTRKHDLLNALDEYLHIEIDGINSSNNNINLLALDMGLKNMSLARLTLSPGTKMPTLSQWFKMNLDPLESQFNPINYSHITCNFLYDQILGTHPTYPFHLIMERQRFRTGGSSAVLESTLKTNTLEAMLCMGIISHNKLINDSNKAISLSASPPGAMVKYWQRLFYPNAKLSEKESKSFRIELVLNMLMSTLQACKLEPKEVKSHALINSYINPKDVGIHFTLSNDITHGLSKWLTTKEGTKSWNAAWSFKANTRRLWEVARLINQVNTQKYKIDDNLWAVKKGDDLADSLLHGIAYFEYMKNRQLFLSLLNKKGKLKDFIQA